MNDILLNTLLLLAVIVSFITLYRRGLRDSPLWRATVTPLASIIGSGFLIVAPLLDGIVGGWAPLAILLIVLLAYGIGAVIRYNIRYLEPQLEQAQMSRGLNLLTRSSDLALALAYVISVAFYLRLLASFLLRAVEVEHDFFANLITTAILAFIGITGAIRGLRTLEELEKYAVYVKLSIITALLLGLVVFDFGWLVDGSQYLHSAPVADWDQALRVLAGVLIIVQGFETSRYMGDSYDAETRIRTMRYAQWLSGAIYLVFVILALPLLSGFSDKVNETAIIGLSEKVADSLPAMLILAAVMSQFSAAVADTIGAGGLLHEVSNQHLRPRWGYVLVTSLGIALVWVSNIFEIIALASRAFALYYLIQTLMALVVAQQRAEEKRLRQGMVAMAVLLLLVVVFAIPAG